MDTKSTQDLLEENSKLRRQLGQQGEEINRLQQFEQRTKAFIASLVNAYEVQNGVQSRPFLQLQLRSGGELEGEEAEVARMSLQKEGDLARLRMEVEAVTHWHKLVVDELQQTEEEWRRTNMLPWSFLSEQSRRHMRGDEA
ncbi:hypothetical protein JOB18_021566 [Solea senegalensis]|uniref:Uncharacterized protein n=1 Tax=Solea senegalensis TaxID=28829 RepID=A0AAV6QV83_SOLSE|nr:hypothetical protein JOB18_021566 [Solea senegalensis]